MLGQPPFIALFGACFDLGFCFRDFCNRSSLREFIRDRHPIWKVTSSAASAFAKSFLLLAENAKIYFKNGEYGSAELTFRQPVKRRYENVEGWLGLVASTIGRVEEADRAYEVLERMQQPGVRAEPQPFTTSPGARVRRIRQLEQRVEALLAARLDGNVRSLLRSAGEP